MTLPNPLLLALPELIVVGAALLLLVGGAFRGRPSPAFAGAAVVALLAAALAAALVPLGRAFSGALILDAGAVFAKAVIYLASAVAVALGDRWLARRGTATFEDPVLVLLAALGMGMMVSAGDLISLYVSIELHSLALYILAAFLRDDERSSEAGLKYFVLSALSSGLLLYGASLIYGFAGSTRFDLIAQALRASGTHPAGGPGVLFGLVFLMCGFGFKLSAAPFHMWTPDVYDGAPTPIVGFFAGAPKLAAMVLLARVLSQAFGAASWEWRQILVAMALMSVAVGAFGGLTQTRLKRLWAYSSIATIGYVLVGLAAGGVIGIQSMLMYMVLFIVDVTGFFACLGGITRGGKPLETMDDFAGLARERPAMAACMTIFALSALGLPPLGELWGKFYVFRAAWAAGSGLGIAAVLALVGSVVAAFFYLRVVKVMWLDPSKGPTDPPTLEARIAAYGLALFAFPIVLVALAPLDLATRAAAIALARP
ncbi:MAG: NADH-quinone oxidoreductase subunit NuoN [Caulobacteraceae bacterium]